MDKKINIEEKHTKLTFNYSRFSSYRCSGMNGYTKNKMYSTLGDHHMYVDTDKIEAGIEKFKVNVKSNKIFLN